MNPLLEKALIARLYEEFQHIGYTYRLKLRRPIIDLRPLSGRWGLWDPETRTVSLAYELVERYAWDAVLEVFKHEIAHLMVSDYYGGDEAHGPLFHRVARSLGISEWAIGAEAEHEDLEKLRGHPSDQPEDRLLARVQKLLALATSSNEHEAALAMKKVQELYTRYNLERLAGRAERTGKNMISLPIKLKKKRVERYQTVIAGILNDFYFVEVIHTSLYDVADKCEYKVIELLGTRENVLMAEYVFHFLMRQLDSLWKNYREVTGKEVRAKNSYYLGVLAGFRDQLEQNLKQVAGKALVKLKDRELDEFVSYRYPRLVRIRAGSRFHDTSSYQAGKSDGWQIRLRRAMEEKMGFRGNLLKKG